MRLRVPILEMHDVAATERARPVGIWRLLVRRLPESLLPRFLALKLVSVAVGVSRLVPHQFHEPLWSLALDLEHHRPLQRAQPIVDEKKRHENRRNTDGHEPFIADVGWRMKREPVGRKLLVKLSDERFQCCSLEAQAEHRDPALEKF